MVGLGHAGISGGGGSLECRGLAFRGRGIFGLWLRYHGEGGGLGFYLCPDLFQCRDLALYIFQCLLLFQGLLLRFGHGADVDALLVILDPDMVAYVVSEGF